MTWISSVPQAFIPLIGSPLFGLIYKHTVESLPQTFLLVSAALYLVNGIGLVYINFGVRKIAKAKKEAAAMEMESNHVTKEVLEA